MTFSVAGRCVRTGRFGVAIASSSPAVGARCAHVRSGVGAACSQNVTDPRLGQELLDAMAAGATARQALSGLVAARPFIEWRQLSAIAGAGEPAAYSGSCALGRHGDIIGKDVVVAGNLLADEGVLTAAVGGFGDSDGQALPERLLAALVAAEAAGGEEAAVRSAALVVVADVAWAVTDLRVDWSHEAIDDLQRLWERWRPQEAAYRQRGLHPDTSPGYGVPGDPRRGSPP